MRLRSFIRQLRRWTQHRRGNVAIVFGFALPVLVGAAGLGVETSYWYYRHQVLQAAANQAAYGGALERRAGSSMSTVRSAALQLAGDNGFDTVNGTLTLNSPPTTGSH